MLGSSRKTNMRSLKAALKRRKQRSAAVMGGLRGVEKRAANGRQALAEIRGVLAASLPKLVMPVTPETLAAVDWSQPAAAKHLTSLERGVKVATEQFASLTTHIVRLTKALDREDQSLAETQQEMDNQTKAVTTFMNDTMRLVDDITREVTVVQPDMKDNLTVPGAPGDDQYVISSLFRLHTRPRTLPASNIFPRRRGAAAVKTEPVPVKAEPGGERPQEPSTWTAARR